MFREWTSSPPPASGPDVPLRALIYNKALKKAEEIPDEPLDSFTSHPTIPYDRGE